MRFLCNRADMQYIVDPPYVETERGRPPRRHVGITVQFRKHSWDSERAQRELRWTDEQREWAERHLMEHADFVQGPFLQDHSSDGGGALKVKVYVDLAAHPELRRELATEEQVERAQGHALCMFTVIDPQTQESRLCGARTAKKDPDYCARHREMVEMQKAADAKEAREGRLTARDKARMPG